MSDLAKDNALTETNHRIRVGRAISADCNFLSRIDNLGKNSKPLGGFEERSFNIWQFSVDRRIVKRTVVHRTSEFGLEDRSSGCGVIWHQVGLEGRGGHGRETQRSARD